MMPLRFIFLNKRTLILLEIRFARTPQAHAPRAVQFIF